MKKLVVLSVCLVAMLAVSTVSKAAMYELDEAMALDMRILSRSTGDSGSLWFVGTLTGPDQIPNTPDYPDIYGSDTMIYQVGFTGNISEGTPIDGSATAWIGLANDDGLGLNGTYDQGFALPIANDNGDIWRYRAFYQLMDDDPIFSDQAILLADTATTLYIPGSLNLSQLVAIGFEIQWVSKDNPSQAGGFKTGDQYSTSVVPVPGAILLGLLGISAAGIKLRRFA